MKKKWPNFIFIIVLVCILLIDQWSKLFFQASVKINPGIAFGWQVQWLERLSLLLIFLFGLFILTRHLLNQYPLFFGLFFGGALSNLVDRFFYSGVRDFIPLPLTHLTNNLADWAVSLSLIGFMLSLCFTNNKFVHQ